MCEWQITQESHGPHSGGCVGQNEQLDNNFATCKVLLVVGLKMQMCPEGSITEKTIR